MTDHPTAAVWQTELPDLPPPKRGKVRDLYDLGDTLLLVACDRISAYDHILQPAIPGKGKILHQLSVHWFEALTDLAPHHLLAIEPEDFPARLKPHADVLRGRAALVRKAEVIPFECVARGYLAGSAFRAYGREGAICGVPLPPGLVRADRLAAPIFTPATKAEDGHDENVDFAYVANDIGEDVARELKRLTLALYRRGVEAAETKGLILADTKFEFGWSNGAITLIDEVLTPDSSRYWDADAWRPGHEPISFDKQYVRNWLDDEAGWDKSGPPPTLPGAVVRGTLDRYVEAFRRLTGRDPAL
ncbi:MAG: phosphoribosylaminoimidazolesuccinocarboxamide synthase [Acidobacteriota bacterium]